MAEYQVNSGVTSTGIVLNVNDTMSVLGLADGKVTLWFAYGDESKWNAETLTYNDGRNSVVVSGVGAENVTLKFGDDTSVQYAVLLADGAFSEFSSEHIFENSGKGMLA